MAANALRRTAPRISSRSAWNASIEKLPLFKKSWMMVEAFSFTFCKTLPRNQWALEGRALMLWILDHSILMQPICFYRSFRTVVHGTQIYVIFRQAHFISCSWVVTSHCKYHFQTYILEFHGKASQNCISNSTYTLFKTFVNKIVVSLQNVSCVGRKLHSSNFKSFLHLQLFATVPRRVSIKNKIDRLVGWENFVDMISEVLQKFRHCLQLHC